MGITAEPKFKEKQKVYIYGLEEFEGNIQSYTRKYNTWFYIIHLIGQDKNVVVEEDSIWEECR